MYKHSHNKTLKPFESSKFRIQDDLQERCHEQRFIKSTLASDQSCMFFEHDVPDDLAVVKYILNMLIPFAIDDFLQERSLVTQIYFEDIMKGQRSLSTCL